MKAIHNRLVDLSRRAAVAVHVNSPAIASRPTRNKWIRIGQLLVLLLLFTAPIAMAQQTIGDSFDTGAKTVDSGKNLMIKIGTAGGVLALLTAAALMYRRSKEGENSQVKVGMIFGLFLAGVIFAGGGALLLRAGGSVGLQSSDYGTVPGN